MIDRHFDESGRSSAVECDVALAMVRRGEADWDHAGASILALEHGFASISRPIRQSELNPNGAVSGPTLFWMCDAALFVSTLATRGEGADSASTVSITMNFLRAEAPAAIQADCRLLRNGKRLIVGNILVFPVGESDKIIANATGIFSARPIERPAS